MNVSGRHASLSIAAIERKDAGTRKMPVACGNEEAIYLVEPMPSLNNSPVSVD
jgi:hypothetical protein